MKRTALIVFLTCSFPLLVCCDIYLEKPTAFWPDKESLKNRGTPLMLDGSDFPCKNAHKLLKMHHYEETAWQVGTYQYVILEGTGNTTEDGGSCQFALSLDHGHTFKVLRSIVGGCPSSPFGSLGTGDIVYLPLEIPSGKALFAWTWFNSRGTPRMYMNCAPVTINNPTKRGSLEQFNELPNLFFANIGNCNLREGSDVIFPGAQDVSGAARSAEQPPEACLPNRSNKRVSTVTHAYLSGTLAPSRTAQGSSSIQTELKPIRKATSSPTHTSCESQGLKTTVPVKSSMKPISYTSESKPLSSSSNLIPPKSDSVTLPSGFSTIKSTTAKPPTISPTTSIPNRAYDTETQKSIQSSNVAIDTVYNMKSSSLITSTTRHSTSLHSTCTKTIAKAPTKTISGLDTATQAMVTATVTIVSTKACVCRRASLTGTLRIVSAARLWDVPRPKTSF
ncbi:hypothetical protein AOL_s00091g16 [Orbilia oligospora ATCC 24927]|uniref:Lytic polysaccharide monooxygenase n=1 Tax=Arthrobotrys oligospora (strain ATCC 24927 / CBS 115.81 / DSM 1491) TaxID=756982 RepID=G1XHW4_ARTOA|nr:hypothetical protein AOL_s00091g16 [Orbilia oligospora ATCC 24927]EGX47272.1 hypothetical protein AOL_s00091g16 [Orbilia oligospora ATCC 24927]